VNNLKQMGVAAHAYHGTFKRFPFGYGNSGYWQYTSWELQLYPYIEQASLFSNTQTWLKANPGYPWQTANPSMGTVVSVFVCPSNTRPTTMQYSGMTIALTSYLGNAGTVASTASADGVLFTDSKIRLTDIADGSSNTLLVGERPSTGDLYAGWLTTVYGWGYGEADCTMGARDTTLAGYVGDSSTNVGLKPPTNVANTAEIDGAHWWSFHTGGVNFLFCDGSVQFLSYAADSVLPQLSTRAGGETFNLP